MPVIRVDIATIPREQKISLIEKLTAVSAEITKIPAQAFTVLINEMDEESIGVGGKTLTEVKKSHRP